MAAEDRAEAEALAEVHSVVAHEAEEASVVALLAAHTEVASEAHTMEAHSVALMVEVSADIIILPHPHIITIITAHTSGVHTDPGAVLISAVASVADAFLPL